MHYINPHFNDLLTTVTVNYTAQNSPQNARQPKQLRCRMLEGVHIYLVSEKFNSRYVYS